MQYHCMIPDSLLFQREGRQVYRILVKHLCHFGNKPDMILIYTLLAAHRIMPVHSKKINKAAFPAGCLKYRKIITVDYSSRLFPQKIFFDLIKVLCHLYLIMDDLIIRPLCLPGPEFFQIPRTFHR